MEQNIGCSGIAGKIVNISPFPIFIVNIKDYSINFANPKADSNGFKISQKCYQHRFTSRKKCRAANRHCPIAIIRKTGKEISIERIQKTKTGQRIYEICAVPISICDPPKISHAVLYFKDITKYRQELRALRVTDDILKLKRESLKSKDNILREILFQLESEKRRFLGKIQSKLEKAVEPLLLTLEKKVSTKNREYVTLLRASLRDISTTFLSDEEDKFSMMTPREMEICHMIRNGMRSKEIAVLLDISVQTIEKQRSNIRKKLKLRNKDINLMTYLSKLSK